MLDISQVRQLSEESQNRISKREQKAMDFMNDPSLHEIITEFVDATIRQTAEEGESTALIGTYGYEISAYWGDNIVLYSMAEEFDQGIAELIHTYGLTKDSDKERIYAAILTALRNIVLPPYEEQYSVDMHSDRFYIHISW